MSRKANYTRKSSKTRTSSKTRKSSKTRMSDIIKQSNEFSYLKNDSHSLLTVKRTASWDLDINVPSSVRIIDLSNYNKIILCEKKEIADAIKQTDFVQQNGYYVHAIGGNPFSSVKRIGLNRGDKILSQNPKIRKSLNFITWRTDKKEGNYFYYPVVDKNADVIIVADEDYMGRYIAYNLQRVIQTEKVRRINEESTSSKYFDKILTSSTRSTKKPIGETFYITSQSEVGANFTSAFGNADGIIDRYTQLFRSQEQPYSEYRKKYLQGIQNANFSDVQISLMSKVLDESLKQDINITLTLETEAGIQRIQTKVNTANIKKFDKVYFEATERMKLNVMNTDETVMQLMNDLKINSRQIENIIKRMSSQSILSYPRTSEQGISSKEVRTNEELLNIWLQYANIDISEQERKKALQRMNKIRTEKGKSGLLVIDITNLPKESIEYQVVEHIAEYNLMAVLGAERVRGSFVFEYTTNDNRTKKIETDEIDFINSTKFGRGVGEVIDVATKQRLGMSEYELYRFLAKNDIGTIATRSSILTDLKEKGLLLEYEGEFRLDDRARVLINTLKEAEKRLMKKQGWSKNYNVTEGLKFLKMQRDSIETQQQYLKAKEQLYNIIIDYMKTIDKIEMRDIQKILIQQNEILQKEKTLEELEGAKIEIQ